jgi:hypothetical protein
MSLSNDAVTTTKQKRWLRWDETAGPAESQAFRNALEVPKGDQPMRKVSRQMRKMEVEDKPAMTLSLDLGDRFSHYCLLNAEGDVVEEGRIQNTNQQQKQKRH